MRIIAVKGLPIERVVELLSIEAGCRVSFIEIDSLCYDSKTRVYYSGGGYTATYDIGEIVEVVSTDNNGIKSDDPDLGRAGPVISYPHGDPSLNMPVDSVEVWFEDHRRCFRPGQVESTEDYHPNVHDLPAVPPYKGTV
jgi:hypothetical protein